MINILDSRQRAFCDKLTLRSVTLIRDTERKDVYTSFCQDPGKDIWIVCSDGHTSAHRLMLSLVSPIVRDLVLENPLTDTIYLPDFQVSLVNSLLQLIYIGEVTVSQPESVEELAQILAMENVTTEHVSNNYVIQPSSQVATYACRPSSGVPWELHTSAEGTVVDLQNQETDDNTHFRVTYNASKDGTRADTPSVWSEATTVQWEETPAMESDSYSDASDAAEENALLGELPSPAGGQASNKSRGELPHGEEGRAGTDMWKQSTGNAVTNSRDPRGTIINGPSTCPQSDDGQYTLPQHFNEPSTSFHLPSTSPQHHDGHLTFHQDPNTCPSSPQHTNRPPMSSLPANGPPISLKHIQTTILHYYKTPPTRPQNPNRRSPLPQFSSGNDEIDLTDVDMDECDEDEDDERRREVEGSPGVVKMVECNMDILGNGRGASPSSTSAAYQCHSCYHSFDDRELLELHVKRTHSGPGEYRCSNCTVTFHDRHSLTRHRMEHKRGDIVISCPICGKTSTEASIRRHILMQHGRAAARRHPVPFTCKICKDAFPTSQVLANHVGREHRLASVKLDAKKKRLIHQLTKKSAAKTKAVMVPQAGGSTTVEEARRLACLLCDEKFVSEAERRKHNTEVHVNATYRCTQCFQSFDSELAYHKHAISHREEGATTDCMVCERKYQTRSGFLHHVKSHHTDDLKYDCQHCPRKFTTQKGMAAHFKVQHANKEPVQSKGTIKEARRDTAREMPPCSVNSADLPDPNSLEEHNYANNALAGCIEFPYACNICKNVYRLPEELGFHYHQYHT